MHSDLSVIMRGNLKVSRGFLLNMPEARAKKITLLGLCLLQQRAGEKQAEGKEGLEWDGRESKEECLKELEKEAPLCHADRRTALVGLVLLVHII